MFEIEKMLNFLTNLTKTTNPSDSVLRIFAGCPYEYNHKIVFELLNIQNYVELGSVESGSRGNVFRA